jgi:hypothetical protein
VFERPRSVPSFLAESQCRVIEHCRLLLKSQDLAAERRQRLTGWSKWPKPNCSVYTPDDRNPATILPRRFPTQLRASGRAPETFPPPSLALPNFEDVLRAR